MYDYRNDVINLMKSTTASQQSLSQSIQALDLIVKVYQDSLKQKPTLEKMLSCLQRNQKLKILKKVNPFLNNIT
ncbi:hypothetical protein [Lactobacillus sp. PV012]|uniref:hypothetical protein n=1 Tax=Lactobacillus sp. PV012 TaxID=2594494 RepID=UPI00223EDB4E|nr:hypothetical protein [Lactobacillus sp. PV012]QNQ82398.1 hypothetical protein FP433_04780 [Lactobacillus sp. PV012]